MRGSWRRRKRRTDGFKRYWRFFQFISAKMVNPGFTATPRGYPFEKNIDYRIKVTIFAENTTSEPFKFGFSWDGTMLGFKKAIKKDP